MTAKISEHVDERLTELLAVERRLEARFEEAVAQAKRKLEAARALASDSHLKTQAELEAASAAQERADLEAQAERLKQIAEDGASRVAALAAVSAERVDALAAGVVDQLVDARARR